MRLSFSIFYLTAVAYAQAQTPAISSAQPNPVNAGGPGFTLTVNGSGFAAGAVVKWSGTALATTLVSDTLLTATVPATLIAICGNSPLTVTNPLGVNSNSNYAVLVNPVLNGISPNVVPAGSGGFTVTATGLGFSSNAVLTLNGSNARAPLPTNYVSTTTLTAFIPTSALTGPFPVSLQVTDPTSGGSSQTLLLTLTYAQIGTISPDRVNAGGAGFALVVSGANFVPGVQVLWNGTALRTQYNDSTFLVATVPASLYSDPLGAQVGISVKNPGTVATGGAILIVFPNPNGTTVTSLDPPAAVTGGPSFTLTVNGSRFTQGSTIVWVTTRLATVFVDSTKLTATVSADLILRDGVAPISVATPGVTDSNAVNLPILTSSPTIASITPSNVLAGGPAFTLTVNGSGFIPASSVVGIPQAATNYVSFTQLTASVPASAIASAGSLVIRVTNPGGLTSPAPATLTVKAPAPVLLSLSPVSVAAGGSDFTLTVTGSAFTASAVVAWNGSALATTRLGPAQLTALVPAALIASAGTASVTVSNEGPVISNVLPFAIAGAAPSVVSLSPSSATVGGTAFTLTVNGAGFTANSKVQWNGAALPTTFTNNSQLTARVPANLIATAGTASVTVTGDGGASSALAFAIAPVLPTTSAAGIVNAASSASALAPGTLISIYGSNLSSGNAPATEIPLPGSLGGTTVSINGTAAPLLFVSPGQINAQVPYEIKPGTASLTVQSGGLQSASVNFDVAATGPGVFVAPQTTHAVAQNLPDFTLNSATAPALPGQYCTLYVTGQGALDNPVPSGAAAPNSPFSLPLAPVQVRIGGQAADVQFAGLAPGFVGLLQINVKIPNLAAGEQALEVTIGGVKASPTVISVGSR